MRLEKQWREFCVTCFGSDLSKQQYIDLRRTFYGGAVSMLMVMIEVPVEQMSNEDLLSEVQAELLSFNEDVKAGKA